MQASASENGREVDSFWSSLPPELARARVLSLERSAAFCGVSPATFERLVAAGRGPAVLRLSERRRGCRIGDLADWLAGRMAGVDAP